MNTSEPRWHAFGEFRIDAVARMLSRRDGTVVPLTARVFDTLLYLVRHAGVSLSKDDLLAAIWPGRVVEENNLTQSISTLRKVLGAETDGARYIVTESGRGYRFVADVQSGSDAPTSPQTPNAISAQRSEPLRQRSWRGFAFAAVCLIGLIVVGIWLVQRHVVDTAKKPASTIAVLPFKPLLPGDRDDVLELGMADTLIAKLSSSRQLVVSSLGSVRKFNSLDQDPIAAGRELSVGSILEGQVQRRADHVHVTARLLSVPNGAALWTGTFDENFTDVFAMQDAIAEKVATALALKFDSDEQAAMKAGYTRNSDAYLLYLQGRYRIGKVTAAEIHSGMESFRKAIDLDPTFALAYAALAEAYRRLPITSDEDPKEAFPLARAAARKALEIDDRLADAHSVLGWVAFWYDLDWTVSEKEFRRAIELNPSVAEAHLGFGHLLSNTGHNVEAIEQGRIARELDPLSPLVNTISAGFLLNGKRDEEAQAILNNVLKIDPDFWVAHLLRGGRALGERNYVEAIAQFTRAKDASGGSTQAVSMLGFALAKSGNIPGAQALLDELVTQSEYRYVPATSMATIYVALGDKENAIAWLIKAQQQRDVRMAFFKVDHRWDSLRADPSIILLSQRIGLQ
jgi:DNA-binding winged helix-turn-helix (wHTH) protein/TolB-like protein/Tfp pilus assembly protein PilF